MKTEDFTISITVNATAQQAYDRINRVTEWWTPNLEGGSDKLHDEFTVRFDDIHMSTQKLVELIPARKVVWQVTDSRLNFIQDKTEWTGTSIHFDIAEQDGGTEVRFTHQGLVPAYECFNACSNAWTGYIRDSLRAFIDTGKGNPG